ncbi:MAG: hypothetical protein DRI90_05815 [Deltaproteobacteria bacterium]|nr:MAG: hypothetical protein DRI90_05815 [Deltaproteobacteria bacterium]
MWGSACWLRRVTGACLLAGTMLLAQGCTIAMMPLSPLAPRTFTLPGLLDRCLAGSKHTPTVALLDPGKPPHKRLRFIPRSGIESQIRLLTAPAFGTAEYTLETEWHDAGARGNTCHRFTLRGGLDPEDDEADPIVGVIALTQLGAMGVWTDGLDPTSRRIEHELSDRLALTVPLLPREPVGVGARWRYRDEGSRRGVKLAIDVHYELLARQGNQINLRVERHVDQEAGVRRTADGTRQEVEAAHITRIVALDFDLRERPFPSARAFDEQGREVERIIPAFR